jgi:hypothetical protein
MLLLIKNKTWGWLALCGSLKEDRSGFHEFFSCKMRNHMLTEFNWAIFVSLRRKNGKEREE